VKSVHPNTWKSQYLGKLFILLSIPPKLSKRNYSTFVFLTKGVLSALTGKFFD